MWPAQTCKMTVFITNDLLASFGKNAVVGKLSKRPLVTPVNSLSASSPKAVSRPAAIMILLPPSGFPGVRDAPRTRYDPELSHQQTRHRRHHHAATILLSLARQQYRGRRLPAAIDD